VIHDPGFGAYPAYGKKVRINYKGMLLDGTVFEDSFKNTVAFEFTVGTGEVITGMDEGIQYLKERGKVTLYIPSSLAYGPKAAGPFIKPNSNLVFY
jgi:FKBP-type peptidyl-prolyl cis-trans isomerase